MDFKPRKEVTEALNKEVQKNRNRVIRDVPLPPEGDGILSLREGSEILSVWTKIDFKSQSVTPYLRILVDMRAQGRETRKIIIRGSEDGVGNLNVVHLGQFLLPGGGVNSVFEIIE